MARSGLNKEINTFVKGVITEGNPLSFPEDASIIDENALLNLDGSRQRRLGVDVENNAKGWSTEYTKKQVADKAISVHEWRNVDNDASKGLLMIQVGKDLFFFDLFGESLSNSIRNSGNILRITPGFTTDYIQSANISGRLVLAKGTKTLIVLDYDSDNDVVTPTTFALRIRDTFGVDDGLEVDERPTTLSELHEYNLKNQGWDTAEINTLKSEEGVYPSNSDINYLGKDPGDNEFDGDDLVAQFFNSTPAPKGRFIIDAFDRGSTRQLRLSGSGIGTGGDVNGGGSNTPATEATILDT